VTFGFKDIIGHKPLLIAWIWEILCIGVGLYAMLVLENETWFMIAIFVGVAPFALAMLHYVQTRKKLAGQPDRSKDIVQ